MKDRCVLEFIADGLTTGVWEGRFEYTKELPVSKECQGCNEQTICQYFMPLKRVQNIREGDKLYKRRYDR